MADFPAAKARVTPSSSYSENSPLPLGYTSSVSREVSRVCHDVVPSGHIGTTAPPRTNSGSLSSGA
ncbi:hypothetical protein [Nakamurella aerolata]|uniref:hypothetical protein n=1 Tax=Nakamurella aerolata TaxID=1656892 RepID=UPI001FEAA858|nr:hypothetical protein [Nakamurella aerolata]